MIIELAGIATLSLMLPMPVVVLPVAPPEAADEYITLMRSAGNVSAMFTKPEPPTVVDMVTVVPPAPVATIGLTLVLTSDPPKVIVNTLLPEGATVTLPPTLVMLDRPLRAV